jgi:hypothetical protein
MPHFGCLACKTRLRGTAGEADPMGIYGAVCGSLVEPVGDLREIGGTALSSHAAAHRTPARQGQGS